MFKKWLIEKGIKLLIGAIALGVGIWYISHSIGGASLSYTSVDNFMKQIGSDGNITSVNGCFLCVYIEKLFAVIGDTTEMFWTGIVKHLWILMAIGYGIFIVMHTLTFFREQANSKDIKDLTKAEPKLDFKKWFEKVWKTGVRVLIASALIGAINWGGTDVLRIVTDMIVTPVMYLGSLLSMAATGVISNAQCEIIAPAANTNPLLPVLQPFMCVMGNLNTVMLAGAGGGFALMNYAWLGMGGGLFTWIAGLTLVIMFLVIGFDLVFQVLNVIFKLIFIIIFMPFMIAAAAFEQVWALAKNVMKRAIDMLINSAISILRISLKITIIYAVVYFAADTFYPTPADGFTSILPPLLGKITPQNQDAQTMSVMKVFTTCEQVSLVDGEIDKDKFKSCFNTQKSIVETRYPGAFDFMGNGLDFLLFMIGVFFLYFWIVSPEVDKLLNMSKEGKEEFDYGQWIKDVGKTVYDAPGKIFNALRDKQKDG
jgi:hypothetical protein